METNVAIKSDFADWLSPMLVKELRQGVRTRVFVAMFIFLQLFMLLDISLTMLVASVGSDPSAGTAFFWTMVGLPLLIVLPLSGLNAIGGEMKANTLELIFLTRLTAVRIVVGKWLAIFVQALLLVCTVLPYLVLRYFIGGVNVTTDLETLGWMLFGSAVLAGCATGISAYPSRLVRPFAALFGMIVLVAASNFAGVMFFGVFRGATGGPGILASLGVILCGALLVTSMLEIGAAKIAPPAENHSGALRLIALCGLLIAAGAAFIFPYSVAITGVTFALAVGVCTISLCEAPRWIPSIFRPYASKGFPGRMAGRFLYPGWYTGVLFTLLVFVAFGALFFHQKSITAKGGLVQLIALSGTLLLPVAFIHAFFPRTNKAAAIFFSVQGFCGIVTVFCAVCDGVLKTSLKGLISFLPLSALCFSFDNSGFDFRERLIAVSATTAISLVVLFVVMRRPMRLARAAERESLRLPAPGSEGTSHASLA